MTIRSNLKIHNSSSLRFNILSFFTQHPQLLGNITRKSQGGPVCQSGDMTLGTLAVFGRSSHKMTIRANLKKNHNSSSRIFNVLSFFTQHPQLLGNITRKSQGGPVCQSGDMTLGTLAVFGRSRHTMTIRANLKKIITPVPKYLMYSIFLLNIPSYLA